MRHRVGGRRSRAVSAAIALFGLVALLLAGTPAGAAEPEWNVARIGAPAPAPEAVVAVVDTGVDATHPALAGRVLPALDLVGDGLEGDPNGHGTHVAGTVAGADAGCGAIGVAPDARILPVRVLDRAGRGSLADVARGIRAAADAGADVINLSLGADVVLRHLSGSDLTDAIAYAWSQGSIPVLAAGNDGLLGGLLGSGYGGLSAVVVTATDHRDRAAPYATSIGSARWGIAAPGGDGSGQRGRDVLSALPGRRCALAAGTSMAAPHVSGALAALRSAGLGPADAVERLLDTARPIGARATFGHGLLDVAAALEGLAAPSAHTPPAEPAGTGGPEVPEVRAEQRPPPAPPSTAAAVPPASDAPRSDGSTVGSAGDGDVHVGSTVPEEVPAPDEPVAPAAPSATGRAEEAAGPATAPLTPDALSAGPPAGVVALAVAALALAGTGTGIAARRLGWRQP